MKRSHVSELLSAYIDGEVAADERERIDAHLAGCEACRIELARLRETVALVRSLPEVEPPPSLRQEVMIAVRRTEPEGGAAMRARRGLSWLRRRPAALAAAAIVLFFGVGFLVKNLGGGLGATVPPPAVTTAEAPEESLMFMDDAGSASVAGTDQAVRSESGAPADPARSSAANSGAEGAVSGSARVAQSAATGDLGPPAGPAGRKLIQRADVEMEVDDVATAFRRVSELVEVHGGFVQGSSLVVGLPGDRWRRGPIVPPEPGPRAFLTARVPVEGVTRFVEELGEIGTIDRYNSSSDDITEQYIDAEARLRNLRAQEQRFLEILGQAGNVDEILRVENELWRLRGEIERLQGQLQAWDRLIELATIAIELRPEGAVLPGISAGSGFVERIASAWYQALDAAVSGVAYIIIGAGTLLPWGVLGLLAWLAYRRRADRRPEAGSDA